MVKELQSAEKYIRMAIFQIHNQEIFRVLSQRKRDGVKVEIITLPYDSINDDIRQAVESRFRALEKENAILHFNRWNVGDPGRTTTAVGRWYSFHGKFVVTDKSAIALSANLTQGQEFDAAVIFRNNVEKIIEFNEKFEEILDLFISKKDGFDGSIHEDVSRVAGIDSQRIFEPPKNVDPRHKDHWIRHYPVEICRSKAPIQERLYLTPFDCQGRDFVISLIQEADEYIYISTESFTDEDFSDFLVDTSVNRKVEIKILSGTRSMDFSDRIEDMFRNLLAQEIDVRTTEADLHAKLIITDKALLVSSVNLNKINLGWYVTKKYWRENTETLLICKNSEIIRLAKEEYLEAFYRSRKVQDVLSRKLEETVKRVFHDTFQLHASPEVRTIFARFVLRKQIDVKKLILKIGRITKKLMTHYKRTEVGKQDFISAMALYYLSEGKQNYNQLKENVEQIEKDVDLVALVNSLTYSKLVEKEGDYYKINIDSLKY